MYSFGGEQVFQRSLMGFLSSNILRKNVGIYLLLEQNFLEVINYLIN